MPTRIRHFMMIVALLAAWAIPGAARAAVVYTNFNGDSVGAAPLGPTVATVFTLGSPTFIGSVWNYHYPHQADYYPGYVPVQVGESITITLTSVATGTLDFSGLITDERAGFPFLDGRAIVNQVLPAGTYTVTDSRPETWSFNPTSGNAGLTLLDDTFVPTPEPASMLLISAGLAGLGLARRRRA